MRAEPSARTRFPGQPIDAAIRWLVAAVIAWLLPVTGALAHASLIASSPPDGAIIAAAPDRIVLTFSEPVSPLVLDLVAPDGSRTALKRFVVRDRDVEMNVPADLPRGTHVLSWRVVSEDGHPVGGSVVFSIGAPSGASMGRLNEANRPVRIGLWVSRISLYLGVFLGIGGAFALCWLTRDERPGRRAVLSMLTIGVFGATASVGFQGLDALGAPIGRYFDPDVWHTGFGTSYGRTASIAILALVAAALALSLSETAGRLLSLAALIGAGTALAASGHAASAEPQWLTRAMVFLHGTAIAFWTGTLIPLALALRRMGTGATAALRRFSRAIPVVLATLLIAGLCLAVVQIRSPHALIATDYGRVMLAKLSLVAILLALAAGNRWLLTDPVDHGDKSATRALVRSISIEALIVVLIFAVAATWRFTPPPRALAAANERPVSAHIHTADAMADVTIAPGRAGPVTVTIGLMNGDFGPLPAKEVSVVLSNATAGIEPFRRKAQASGDGQWRVDDIIVPIPGEWSIRLDILITDFDMVKLDGEVEIRR